jgi:enoyl reductase
VSLLAGVSLTVAAAEDPGGPQGGGYQDGRTAGVTLENSSIVLSGNGLGGSADSYRVPRPCWYEPGKSAEEMLQSQEGVKVWWYRTNPGATEEQFEEFLKQYKDKVGQPGRWWSPAYNSADPGGMSCWAGLEGALWVPQGTTPPGGITAEELLQIARAALTVPEPTINLNPDAKSYVNLPTWVWLDGIGATTRSVTATLPGVMSATVTATLNRTEVGSDPGGSRAEIANACGTTGQRDQSGGFTCGVKYLRSSADLGGSPYRLTVTTVWDVAGTSTGGIGLDFAPVQVTVERGVAVGEVQSTVRR